jgi:hypothetical protein
VRRSIPVVRSSITLFSLTWLASLLLTAGPAPLQAQYVPTPGGTGLPGGYGPPRTQEPGERGADPSVRDGRAGMRRSQDMSDMPTLSRIEGPATPAIMRDTVGLSGETAQRYANRYANHMAGTRSVRDSLRKELETMPVESADEGGSTLRDRRPELQRQWKDLSKRDHDFEKGLKDLLTKDQQKRYKKWRQAKEETDRELWESQRRGSAQGW